MKIEPSSKTPNEMVIRDDGTALIRTKRGLIRTSRLYEGYSVRCVVRGQSPNPRLCKGAFVRAIPNDADVIIYQNPKQLAAECNAVLVKSELDFKTR